MYYKLYVTYDMSYRIELLSIPYNATKSSGITTVGVVGDEIHVQCTVVYCTCMMCGVSLL